MDITNRIFDFVQNNYPEIWLKILSITKLHKISSVKKIFNEHLKSCIDDIEIFNENPDNVALFLLKFCEAIQRNFFSPGDSFGTLLSCRLSYVFLQHTLDKRHLKDQNADFQNSIYPLNSDLNFEINMYTCLSKIYDISNRKKFTTIFVKNYTIKDLLNLNPRETCYLKMTNNEYPTDDVLLKTYIITESFVPGYLKIIQKVGDINFIFRHTDLKNIVAFTDLKYINAKCGLICFYFNLINIIKLQFFKKMTLESKHEKDVINIMKYYYYTGTLLPINRTGLRKNVCRSGLEKICFEAIKLNYVFESIKNARYNVDKVIDNVYFGQQMTAGTGYNFAVKNI